MSSDNTQPAMAYPTNDQYNRWKVQADNLDMSVSEFIQSMVEVGIKVDEKFELSLENDESHRKLRRERNDLKKELSHARERIGELEDRLHSGERKAIETFIENNPGATYDDVVQHVMETVPRRVGQHLDHLEGETLSVDDGAYYAANTIDVEGPS